MPYYNALPPTMRLQYCCDKLHMKGLMPLLYIPSFLWAFYFARVLQFAKKSHKYNAYILKQNASRDAGEIITTNVWRTQLTNFNKGLLNLRNEQYF